MLRFNSSSLRYKFIYLTKNVYSGIAINAFFEEALRNSYMYEEVGDDIQFHLIDKYIDFIPFSLRFIDTYAVRDNVFEKDIVLPARWQESKRIMLTNVLFFVDMYNPDMTSFLYISNDKDSEIIKKHIDTFLTHCLGTITGAKKIQCKYFRFTLREQQIVFHLLEGRSIKSISEVLNVSDKAIYMNIRVLSAKLEKQLHPYIYNNMKMKMGSFRAHVSRT